MCLVFVLRSSYLRTVEASYCALEWPYSNQTHRRENCWRHKKTSVALQGPPDVHSDCCTTLQATSSTRRGFECCMGLQLVPMGCSLLGFRVKICEIFYLSFQISVASSDSKKISDLNFQVSIYPEAEADHATLKSYLGFYLPLDIRDGSLCPTSWCCVCWIILSCWFDSSQVHNVLQLFFFIVLLDWTCKMKMVIFQSFIGVGCKWQVSTPFRISYWLQCRKDQLTKRSWGVFGSQCKQCRQIQQENVYKDMPTHPSVLVLGL